MRRALSSTRLAFVLVAAVALSACAQLTGVDDPGVAARVNDSVVTVDDLADAVDAGVDDLVAEQIDHDPQVRKETEADTLTTLVLAELLDQGAADLGVGIDDQDVAEEQARLEELVGGPEGLAQLGVTELELRLFTYETAVLDELVDDEEVAAAAEDLRSARHLLVETEEEAEEAISRIDDDGEDFADVAADVSIDEGSAAQGGELGTITPGQTVPEFEDALDELEVGEMSEPVESQFGWHVIERLDDPGAEGADADRLRQEIGQEAFMEWFEGVLAEAEVEVNPRFGTWQPSQLAVVPSNALDRPSTLVRDPAQTDALPEDGELAPEEGADDELLDEAEPEEAPGE